MTASLLTNQKFKWVFTTLIVVFILLHYYTLISLQINDDLALQDSCISNLLLAVLCWLIGNNLSYYQPKSNKYLYVIIWCLALSAVYVYVLTFILPSLAHNDISYQNLFYNSLIIRYTFAFLLISCISAINILWFNHSEQQELEQRKNEAENLTKEIELSTLREKLQPHFLFNSLNSISALTISNPLAARKMVHQLSDFLRGTLRKDDTLSSLKSELEHLELYLEIEKVRFGNRLLTQFTMNDDALEKTIPPMLLQPLVENAIKFGLYDTLEEVTISISAKFEAPYLLISISNPFDVSTANPNKGTGFGLSSIKRRLHLLYNRTDLLRSKSIENKFITTLKIPQV